MSFMKILVTGGAGFIGSHLTDALLKLEHQVYVLDNLSTGKLENIRGLAEDMFYEIDICNQVSIPWLFEKIHPELVFHLAARPRVQFSIQNPQFTNEVNIKGTLNLLVNAQKYGTRRFVYASSSSIYGLQESLPFVETMTPNPLSPYALQKYTAECYCKLFHEIHHMETVSLRYFNVFGPRQDPFGSYACVIPKFIMQALQGKSFTIRGDGNQTRDFTYIDDIVQATLLAGFSENKEIFGKTMNVGSGYNYSINQIMLAIRNLGGNDLACVHEPAALEPPHTLADTSLIRSMLGWKPKTTLIDGIKNTYSFFREKFSAETAHIQ